MLSQPIRLCRAMARTCSKPPMRLCLQVLLFGEHRDNRRSLAELACNGVDLGEITSGQGSEMAQHRAITAALGVLPGDVVGLLCDGGTVAAASFPQPGREPGRSYVAQTIRGRIARKQCQSGLALGVVEGALLDGKYSNRLDLLPRRRRFIEKQSVACDGRVQWCVNLIRVLWVCLDFAQVPNCKSARSCGNSVFDALQNLPMYIKCLTPLHQRNLPRVCTLGGPSRHMAGPQGFECSHHDNERLASTQSDDRFVKLSGFRGGRRKVVDAS